MAGSDIGACAAADLGEAGPAAPHKAAWTVLCVDDEANIVSALRRVFRGTGYGYKGFPQVKQLRTEVNRDSGSRGVDPTFFCCATRRSGER